MTCDRRNPYSSRFVFLFFFFQAEDGIRDLLVTGVQTCALPIWGISGLFSSGGPSVRFLARYEGEGSEPLVGRQGRRVSMRMARGSASLLSSHSRGIWPRDVLKKVSRGLSRVEAGHPGVPRLVQVTSGGFSWWL